MMVEKRKSLDLSSELTNALSREALFTSTEVERERERERENEKVVEMLAMMQRAMRQASVSVCLCVCICLCEIERWIGHAYARKYIYQQIYLRFLVLSFAVHLFKFQNHP